MQARVSQGPQLKWTGSLNRSPMLLRQHQASQAGTCGCVCSPKMDSVAPGMGPQSRGTLGASTCRYAGQTDEQASRKPRYSREEPAARGAQPRLLLLLLLGVHVVLVRSTLYVLAAPLLRGCGAAMSTL